MSERKRQYGACPLCGRLSQARIEDERNAMYCSWCKIIFDAME